MISKGHQTTGLPGPGLQGKCDGPRPVVSQVLQHEAGNRQELRTLSSIGEVQQGQLTKAAGEGHGSTLEFAW